MSLFKQMNIFDMFFKRTCWNCARSFKFVKGFKGMVYIYPNGLEITEYTCTRCCSSTEEANEMYRKSR